MGRDTASRASRFRILERGCASSWERYSARRVGRGRGTVHFACEATGHVWEAVGAFFEQRALRYHVVNPLATFRVREARQMGRDKRDLTDAELAGVALRRRVASSLPGCTRSRARGVLVFGGVGLPHRCVCHDRGPGRIGGPCVSRGAQAGGVRPLPPPATRLCRGGRGPFTRCRVVRGGGVMRCAGLRVRPGGAAGGLVPPAPVARDTRRVGPRRRAVPARE